MAVSHHHRHMVDHLRRELNLGAFSEWGEEERITFLDRELEGKRPLLPARMAMSPEVPASLRSSRAQQRRAADCNVFGNAKKKRCIPQILWTDHGLLLRALLVQCTQQPSVKWTSLPCAVEWEAGLLMSSACAQVREVIDTFSVAADMGGESLSAYVISMARKPSDVLAVELLKREARFLVSGRAIVKVDSHL